MQVTVQNENTVVVDVQQQETIVVEVDQGRAGRGIQNITYTEVSGQYFLIVTYTDGTTETLGPLVVTGGAAFLLGGATGSIPYQSAPNTTVFLPIGTQNQVVVAGATAPQYTSALTGLTVNNSAIGNTAPSTGAFTNLSASGTFALTGDQVQISEGGTGQTTANGAFNALAPSQTGNAGKYLKTDGTNSSWDQLDISTADITGTLPIANGGTGQTTANSALNALLPTQAAQSGKYLKTDGTNASWDQLDISTADITGVLPIANGGTGASTAPGARANLSAAILGTNNDITSMTGLTGGISTPDFVQFDTTATEANAVGKVYWDASQGTLDLGLLGGNVITRIGQTLVAYVTNAEAVTITKGQVVYLFGAQGDRATVKLASNLSDATSAKTFGVVAENITANGTGFVMCQGVLDGLNLGAFTAGDTLYLGATPGSLTATKPAAPNHLVYVGLVERANPGNGQLYVKVQNGYELDEIHDVQIINPQNGQTILYDASTSLWKNANLTAGTGISVTNGAASVTIGNTGVLSFSGGTTGLTPSTSTTGVVTLGGTLAIGSGGTGQTTANASFNALAPSQTGNAGKYLKSDGTNTSWDQVDISTSDITGILPVLNGGTGANNASDARTNLNAASQSTTISAGTGLTGGGDLSANRTLSIANTTVTAGAYGSASNTLTATVNAQGQLTALAATPIAIANTQISGLGTMSTQNSNSVTITGGSITGITDLAIADGGTGASDAPTARTNLGLGTSATLNAGVALGVATLDAGGTVPLSQLPASIQGGVSYQGSWDAATNTPTIVSSVGTKGYYYVVSVAGSTNINGISDWLPGDWIIFNGSIWQKIDNTDAVASVNGYTGVVVLNAADVGAAPTSRTITAGTGLTGGGDLSANRTISIANTTVAAGSYGSASSVGTFTVNGQGQLTAAASTPIAITNTQVSGLGTMSTQNAGSVAITGGTIDGTTIGGTTRAAGSFTTLTLTNALSVANGGTGTTTSTGTGSVVLSSSPTLTTPNLGTPSAVTLTNATGLPLTTGVTGTLPIGNGGTGQTTANAAFNALAPSQTGNAGKYLTTDGTNTSWATNPLGTVTSVDVSGGTTGLTTSGGPITSSGTITLGGTLATTNGGTGLTSFTANGVVYASSSSALTTGSALTFDGTNLATTGRVTATTGMQNANGTSFYWGAGTAYILGSSATNTINLGTSGVTQATLNSLGNFGLGVTPSAWQSTRKAFQIGTTGSLVSSSSNTIVGDNWYIDGGGTDRYLATGLLATVYQQTSGVHRWFTAGSGTAGNAISFTQAMTLASSGDLGIGTTSPGSRLHVNGTSGAAGSIGITVTNTTTTGFSTVQFGDGTNITGQIWSGNSSYASFGGAGSLNYSANSGPHAWHINYTERMRLDSSGNLGIGTSSPSVKLDVFGRAKIDVGTYASGYALTLGAISETGRTYQIGMVTGGSLAIYDSAAAAQRVVLDTSGNLGLGATSTTGYWPSNLTTSAARQVISYSDATTNLDNANAGLVIFNSNSTAGSSSKLVFGANNTDPTAVGLAYISAVNSSRTTGYLSSSLVFGTAVGGGGVGTGPTERMRIDPSGNLGLGVTPSAWGGNYEAIEFPGISIANFNGGTNQQAQYILNAYDSAAGIWRYKVTGAPAAMYRQSAGLHEWHTAPSGTAGNIISFTQAMTLDAAGALLVGMTSRPNDARIASNGPIYVDAAPYGIGNFAVGSYAATSVFANSGYGLSAISFGRYNGSGTYTSQVLIDPSGNLLLGTTSPVYSSANRGNMTIGGSAGSILFLGTSSTTGGYVFFEQATGSMELWNGANGYTRFGTNNAERARITSGGDLLVGTTGQIYGNAGNIQSFGSSNFVAGGNSGSATCTALRTINNNSGVTVGTITYGASSTAYNTSSDYRLKDNPQPLTGSGAFIDALQPKTWNWTADGSKGVGFIAHEVQEISPGSVVGTKDAVDEEGKPVYQAMEYGSAEFIANIIAELQSLRARVAQLEAK